MSTQKTHWENVYKNKKPDEVSWFQSHLSKSLELIFESKISHEAQIIDVGGGASTLVDDLLQKGFRNISVLDISGVALEISKKRLGSEAERVNWIEGDITTVQLPEYHYDLWHDRAVFHFLRKTKDQKAYFEILRKSLKPGGVVIIASFGLEGPQKCSGLDVMRYSPETLQKELGENYCLTESLKESHQTPFGTCQEFVYCSFRKIA